MCCILPVDTTVEPAPYSKTDQARVWMCYAGFSGDLEKTAMAAQVPLTVVRALEHDFNWVAKLKKLKTGAGAPEAEKLANRAVSYIQARRMRDIVERALNLVEDEEALLRAVLKFKLSKEGDVEQIEVSPKALLDLAKALEAAHSACYRALGDKVPAQADPVESRERSGNSLTTVRDVLNVLDSMRQKTLSPASNEATSI